ncbi:YdcF family protein [Nocardia noduli]|uniref:YdcF family protein n=1 Tax=Nocardia noduli TaxID=2815722 RepID=UPI001C219A00|nr:YdcF family protein [Nocardia noduli]
MPTPPPSTRVLARRPRGAAQIMLGAVILTTATLVHAPSALADDACSVPTTVGSLVDALHSLATVTPQTLPVVHGSRTAIVVLGYGLLPDGSMRPELIDRLRAGYLQALLAPASPIIVTGGNPHNGITEARAMADWFGRQCIPADRVHIEPDADSTRQNAEHSARLMHELGVHDAVVVTSADHLDRAVETFHAAGVDVIGTVTSDVMPQSAASQF